MSSIGNEGTRPFSIITVPDGLLAHGGTRPFFYTVDQYFGNDSLEPFESIFIGSTGLAMAFMWLYRPREYGGTRPFSIITVPDGLPAHEGTRPFSILWLYQPSK